MIDAPVEPRSAFEVAAEPLPAAASSSKCCCADCPVKALKSACETNPLCKSAHAVFMWTAPLHSLIHLAIATAIFAAFHCYKFTLLSLCAYAVLFAIIAAGVYAYGYIAYARYLAGKPDATNPLQGKAIAKLTREQVDPFVDLVVVIVNAVHGLLAHFIFFSDPAISIAFGIGAWFSAWILGKISFITIAYIATLICFIWPRLYQAQKEAIDKYAGMAVGQISEGVKKVHGIILSNLPKKKTQ
jgi:hypothetical protein